MIKDVFGSSKEHGPRDGEAGNTCWSSRWTASAAWPTRWSSPTWRCPKDRFSCRTAGRAEALAPSNLEEEGDYLIIKHLYIERRMTPLNIYLENAERQPGADRPRGEANTATPSRTGLRQHLPRRHAVEELRRHALRPRRVLRLRRNRIHDGLQLPRIPPAPYPEMEMSGEPWYSVAATTSSRRSSAPSCCLPQVPSGAAQDPQGLPVTSRISFPTPKSLRFCRAFAGS
jgi:hypothetical protein